MTALKPNCRGASSSLIIMVRSNYSTLPKAQPEALVQPEVMTHTPKVMQCDRK